MATTIEAYADLEKRMELIATTRALLDVERERVRRSMRRLDRLEDDEVVPEGINPAWEKRTRNVALVAALGQLISIVK